MEHHGEADPKVTSPCPSEPWHLQRAGLGQAGAALAGSERHAGPSASALLLL